MCASHWRRTGRPEEAPSDVPLSRAVGEAARGYASVFQIVLFPPFSNLNFAEKRLGPQLRAKIAAMEKRRTTVHAKEEQRVAEKEAERHSHTVSVIFSMLHRKLSNSVGLDLAHPAVGAGRFVHLWLRRRTAGFRYADILAVDAGLSVPRPLPRQSARCGAHRRSHHAYRNAQPAAARVKVSLIID